MNIVLSRIAFFVLSFSIMTPLYAGPIEDFASGSGFAAGGIMVQSLKMTVVAILLLWLVWIVVAAFRSWNAHSSDSASFVSVIFRAALLIGVTGIILDIF